MVLIQSSFFSSIPSIFHVENYRSQRIRNPWAAACGALVLTILGGWVGAAAQTKAATSTSLAVTSGGIGVTTVASGSVVTLTATVNAGTPVVSIGQVNFCDASAAHCTDIHLLGTAQLTSAGAATLKFRPGIGTHSYKAIFLGTNTDVGSASAASPLAVAGVPYPVASATQIAETGSWGNYALTATVTEAGGLAAPTGTVSFQDKSSGSRCWLQGTWERLSPGSAGPIRRP